MIWNGGDYRPERWPEEVWAEGTLMQPAGLTNGCVDNFPLPGNRAVP